MSLKQGNKYGRLKAILHIRLIPSLRTVCPYPKTDEVVKRLEVSGTKSGQWTSVSQAHYNTVVFFFPLLLV